MHTVTPAPSCTSLLTTSATLYAAIPPQTATMSSRPLRVEGSCGPLTGVRSLEDMHSFYRRERPLAPPLRHARRVHSRRPRTLHPTALTDSPSGGGGPDMRKTLAWLII